MEKEAAGLAQRGTQRLEASCDIAAAGTTPEPPGMTGTGRPLQRSQAAVFCKTASRVEPWAPYCASPLMEIQGRGAFVAPQSLWGRALHPADARRYFDVRRSQK